MVPARTRLAGWLLVGVFALSLQLRPALAQGITIQQPVVQRFGVATVVSVPDRGAALLGGVSSLRTSARRDALSFPRSTRGREMTHSSLSAHVVIHDLQAMDEALLSRAGAARLADGDRQRHPVAVAASRQLLRDYPEQAAPASSPIGARRGAQAAAGSARSRFGSFSFK
jgi:hypothetical protein